MGNKYITPPYFIFRIIKTLFLSVVLSIVLFALIYAGHATFYFGKTVDDLLMHTEIIIGVATVLIFPKIWSLLSRPHQIPPHARP